MAERGSYVYLNGEIVRKEEAVVSVFDRAFLYGDGVFEALRTYDGKIFKLHEHLDRVFRSCHAIGIKPPLTKEELGKAVMNVCGKNGFRNSYVRITITRGQRMEKSIATGLDPRTQ